MGNAKVPGKCRKHMNIRQKKLFLEPRPGCIKHPKINLRFSATFPFMQPGRVLLTLEIGADAFQFTRKILGILCSFCRRCLPDTIS